ncbi:MAG: hypothetical protein JO360_00455 [Acidobacteria bacterium]|nr:hypothetical protein [Acidobacteriota bacterium]
MREQRPPAFLPRRQSIAFIIAVLFVSLFLRGTAEGAGELDQSFGNSGKTFTNFSNMRDVVYDMAVQPDGKIVAVGFTTYVNSSNIVDTNFALARYNPDGSLDGTFGSGGKVSTDFNNTDDVAYAVALQPDGRIVVVGSTLSIPYSGSPDFAVARYNSDGTLDNTFGSGGKVTSDFETTDNAAKAVVIQPDGKIVVGGYAVVHHPFSWDQDYALIRLNGDGSFDNTFDGDGKLTTNFLSAGPYSSESITSLALYPDGRILAGGSNNYTGVSLARYNFNGSPDGTFDTDGQVIAQPFSTNGYTLRALALQPDGKIVTAGTTTFSYNTYTPRAFALVRYNVDGGLDTSFSGDGGASLSPAAGDEIATDVALASGGKIVVAGYSPAIGFTVARFQSNGNLDPVFGASGRFYTSINGSISPAFAVAIQADGKILVGGQTTELAPEVCDFAIVRYQANPASLPIRSDFDGDGRSDLAVFRPADGNWYVINSSNGAFSAQPFGASGDIAAPGDYDGDGGRTDYAVFRPSNGTWYVRSSSDNSFRAVPFGANGDVPVAADYDGDAKTDLAVFRPSNGYWYILRSSDNGFQAVSFGTATDKLVPGYYDNDSKADIAVFRESTGNWYILESSTNSLSVGNLGSSGDQPVPGDYDADGKFDLAVFRPSTGFWYIYQSRYGAPVYVRWGAVGDIAVPGDFNGDFVTDVCVWRPSGGDWYHYVPSNYGTPAIHFGASGDTPVLKAYLP